MAGVSHPSEVPKRALLKAAEVCDLLKVQPYVLRSWESEFPELGVAKTAGGPRVYRPIDIEQVMRIKHLLLVEGLTLAGARRKLEDEAAPAVAIDELIGPEARDRLTAIKRGLRAILDLLSTPGADEGFVLQPPAPSAASSSDSAPRSRPARRRGNRDARPERTVSRRKRSA
jgi:DNA-binding transcriptional MerR regulator